MLTQLGAFPLIFSLLASNLMLCSLSPESDYLESSLQVVAILHRHGFRAPERTFASDPYGDAQKYWPEGWGQLLPKGKRDMYQLGETLRDRYKGFIDRYAASAVKVNSSDYDRCHMSAALLLAGWFPPDEEQKWSDNLLWQPIPIHSKPTSEDPVLAQEAPCPRYKLEAEKVSQQIKANETEEDKMLYKYLTKYMAQPITNFHQLESFYLTLQIEERFGYKLPEWTKSVYPDLIREKAQLSLESHTWTRYMQRVLGGLMIKEFLDKFTNKMEGRLENQKVLIYSAHDTTLMSFLRALQFKDHLWPEYGAALLFELHKSPDDSFFVKLLYFNETSQKEPHDMIIPGCGEPCGVKELHQITEYMRSVDWEKDCAIMQDN